MVKIYYPYLANDDKHKFFIITNQGKRVYFGQAGASDYTIHKDLIRKNRYILRHKKREEQFWNKAGINTASFWSRFLLWEKPTLADAYDYIKKNFL